METANHTLITTGVFSPAMREAFEGLFNSFHKKMTQTYEAPKTTKSEPHKYAHKYAYYIDHGVVRKREVSELSFIRDVDYRGSFNDATLYCGSTQRVGKLHTIKFKGLPNTHLIVMNNSMSVGFTRSIKYYFDKEELLAHLRAKLDKQESIAEYYSRRLNHAERMAICAAKEISSLGESVG